VREEKGLEERGWELSVRVWVEVFQRQLARCRARSWSANHCWSASKGQGWFLG